MAIAVPIVLGTILMQIAASVVTRVLLTIGFGVVTYYGIGAMFADAETQIFSLFGSTGGSIMSLLVMARVDDFMRVIFSAYLASLSLRGLTAAGAIAIGKWANSGS